MMLETVGAVHTHTHTHTGVLNNKEKSLKKLSLIKVWKIIYG